jgi:methionyl-tRNA formyltransferase
LSAVLSTTRRAVVFAYHNVGVRCLRVLLDAGVEVALVVTHEDSSSENIWFGSVAALAHGESIPSITPADPNAADVIAMIEAVQPDFIFSFYYRQMLSETVLNLARHGAFNLHGSLLPHYRGRAPVNWAVLHGERRTGASLHYMVAKPDAGDLVAQTEVPILNNDSAGEVFEKVTVAAEITLWKVLPLLLALQAPRVALDLKSGSYFGGRKPADGEILWHAGAAAVHNLVRAVAPPYPGAWFDLHGLRLAVHETRQLNLPAEFLPVDVWPGVLQGALSTALSSVPSTAQNRALLCLDGEQCSVVWPDSHTPSTAAKRLPLNGLRLRKMVHAGQPCSASRLRELLSVTDARAFIALPAGKPP